MAVDAGKDAYKAVRTAWDKKKTDYADESDSEDVDVEFYYDDDLENKDSKGGSEEKEMDTEEAGATEDKEKEENSGLLVTEEV